MPNRKLELAQQYLTAPQVKKFLNLSRYQLDIRIERGILPQPTFTDTTGVRYFDDFWLKRARVMLEIKIGV